MNRRGLLKLFGVGAGIVPLIEGMPDMNSRAIIVQPPVVEIPEPPRITLETQMPTSITDGQLVVIYRDRVDGTVWRWDTPAAIVRRSGVKITDVTDVTGVRDSFHAQIPVMYAHATFEVDGPVEIQCS